MPTLSPELVIAIILALALLPDAGWRWAMLLHAGARAAAGLTTQACPPPWSPRRETRPHTAGGVAEHADTWDVPTRIVMPRRTAS